MTDAPHIPKATGYQQWDDETSYGTGGSPDKVFGVVKNFGIKETNEILEDDGMTGLEAYPDRLIAAKFGVAGPVEFELQSGIPLKNAFTNSVTTSGSDPYTHYLIPDRQIPSIIIEDGDDADSDFVRTFSGCKVNRQIISATIGQTAMVTQDIVGQTVLLGASADASPATDSVQPFMYYQGNISWAGATIAEINSFSFEILRNLIPKEYVNDSNKRIITHLIEGLVRFKGNINIDFKNKDQYERLLGAAAATGPLEHLGGVDINITLTRTASNDKITIKIIDAKISGLDMSKKPEELIQENYDLVIRYASIEVLDSTATY